MRSILIATLILAVLPFVVHNPERPNVPPQPAQLPSSPNFDLASHASEAARITMNPFVTAVLIALTFGLLVAGVLLVIHQNTKLPGAVKGPHLGPWKDLDEKLALKHPLKERTRKK